MIFKKASYDPFKKEKKKTILLTPNFWTVYMD